MSALVTGRREIATERVVTILPYGRTVRVEQGSSLMAAITAADVPLGLPCGGQGRCGRCLVIVRSGQVRRRSVARLTPSQIAQGYALSCQTYVVDDVTVFVPSQQGVLARPEAATTSEEAASMAAKAAPEIVRCGHKRPPTIHVYRVEIEPPSLADNTTDWERLQRELTRQHGVREVTASLPTLRKLAGVLRAAQWHVDVIVEAPHSRTRSPGRVLDIRPASKPGRTLGLAIDIGTTSNVVYLVDLRTDDFLGHAAAYNGQVICGEDVISRIIYARRAGGLAHLQELVLKTLNGLIEEVLAGAGAAAEDILAVTVAGNPTMMHLFLGLDPQYIRLDPYIPTINHPLPVLAKELGLNVHPEALVDCLPGVGAYVGADITAGVLRAGISDHETISLFIDVGTNGEIVLGNRDWLISCACSAGPAFEGAGVVCGMRASAGAIEEVWIDPATAEPTYRTIDNEPPCGVCGSGMISLLGEMFITGVTDKSGHLNRALQTPRIRVGEQGPEYVVAWASETACKDRDIVLTEVDIENLVRAKAAIYAGITVLVESVGLSLADIERVLIGGAFGRYIDIEKAIEIGLLPDIPWESYTYLGNTSVQGACLALLCDRDRAQVREIANKMTYLELSADNTFMEAFTSALFLPHTDLGQFPSVASKLAQVERIPR